MDEKISKLFLPLLDKLYNTEPAGEPFRKPVDPVKYGCYDYYLYVKHPIDLSTIRNKLVTNQYKDAWQFVADIQLMFSNAYLFNKKGTPVWEFTNKLSKIWNTELTPIMQRLNYCCGTLHKFGPQLLFCLGTTPDRYCQIAIGSKYKCYQDSYSFCMPCFNKIETDTINIQALTCETSRINLPLEPVKKKDFIDCTNDHWQYENFIQCTQCERRMHQICELYPTEKDEIAKCVQHLQIEEERKKLCCVPPEFEAFARPADSIDTSNTGTNEVSIDKNETSTSRIFEEVESDTSSSSREQVSNAIKSDNESNLKDLLPLPRFATQNGTSTTTTTTEGETTNNHTDKLGELFKKTNVDSQQLDDELLHLARDVEDSQSVDWTPSSPVESRLRFDSAKDSCHNDNNRSSINGNQDQRNSTTISRITGSIPYAAPNNTTTSTKNSVDNIAARLSINKLTTENHVEDHLNQHHQQNHSHQHQKPNLTVPLQRDKFVCNQCYKKQKLGGQNERYRKYSARRLPHSRMSRYIETKVNEYIRENSPTAGEMTIRVLTAYRDTVGIKPEMREYMKRCRTKDPRHHPNLEDYPEEFEYTNRAIFAWQEIDGVDVCVFGMHVQEYGEDCPEPNKQVVYLSYLDSVHFFRPKQFRTAVYHEILLSYFKYVKKLGFRRVFIWVCPSRKGDDYIFYRHPSEQKMPTLKRLSDWYIHLLDKGVLTGIVERHQNIHDYAQTENWSSLFSLPYLSGDYWPGEFERLLKIMIESKKKYEEKLNLLKQQQQLSEQDDDVMVIDGKLRDISELSQSPGSTNGNSIMATPIDRSLERYNVLSLTNLYQKSQPPINNNNGNLYNLKNNIVAPKSSLNQQRDTVIYCTPEGDFNNGPPSATDDIKSTGFFTPDSHRSDDQPLDLSKSSNASPESWRDDDQESEFSYRETNSSARKKRKKSSSTMGYTKKRNRNSSQYSNNKARLNQSVTCDGSSKHHGKATKACRKSSSQANKDLHGSEILLNPEEELMKNLDRSLKRQREGFIVVRLSECDCSPQFESQRRREEVTFTCNMMKGREPFLTLARLENYEFSTLRRAKFSSLAMVKHLGQSFKLDPICNECYSFDSSKRHYACQHCEDFYLCTSCHENTHHNHIMSLMAPITLPDIDEFLQHCSPPSGANSISSASSTISNKSFNETTSMEQSFESSTRKDLSPGIPLHRHLSNTLTSPTSSMPLSCKKQKNHEQSLSSSRAEDEENAHINPFASETNKLGLPKQPSPPPSHSSSRDRQVHVEFDQVLIESFVRHAEVNYSVDFDEMKSESKKLLTHYWSCPIKDTCSRCKFVVLSCSFMSVLMRSTRMQMMVNCNPNEPAGSTTATSAIQGNVSGINNNNNNNGTATHLSGINLTTTPRFGYQPKE